MYSLYQELFNSLWPSDVIWRQGSRSTLAQVMACCLTAPSYYLNQCWLTITKVQWLSSEGNLTTNTSTSIPKFSSKITHIKLFWNPPGANEFMAFYSSQYVLVWCMSYLFIAHFWRQGLASWYIKWTLMWSCWTFQAEPMLSINMLIIPLSMTRILISNPPTHLIPGTMVSCIRGSTDGLKYIVGMFSFCFEFICLVSVNTLLMCPDAFFSGV